MLCPAWRHPVLVKAQSARPNRQVQMYEAASSMTAPRLVDCSDGQKALPHAVVSSLLLCFVMTESRLLIGCCCCRHQATAPTSAGVMMRRERGHVVAYSEGRSIVWRQDRDRTPERCPSSTSEPWQLHMLVVQSHWWRGAGRQSPAPDRSPSPRSARPG